jgi:hypothetical protein
VVTHPFWTDVTLPARHIASRRPTQQDDGRSHEAESPQPLCEGMDSVRMLRGRRWRSPRLRCEGWWKLEGVGKGGMCQRESVQLGMEVGADTEGGHQHVGRTRQGGLAEDNNHHLC